MTTRPSPSTVRDLPHVPAVRPLHFPAQEPMEEHLGQSTRHLHLCALLYQILRACVGPEHSRGSDQFVYFDASQPKRCLAPDGFVKLGIPNHDYNSWKTWEKGAPELCVEILSPSDSPEAWSFDEKILRYWALGTRELVAFDIDAPVGSRLRVWDRVDDELVERVVHAEKTPCITLGLHWVIASSIEAPIALRLSRDVDGEQLVLTAEEAERAAKEAERAAKEAERSAKEAERAAKELALGELARLKRELAERG